MQFLTEDWFWKVALVMLVALVLILWFVKIIIDKEKSIVDFEKETQLALRAFFSDFISFIKLIKGSDWFIAELNSFLSLCSQDNVTLSWQKQDEIINNFWALLYTEGAQALLFSNLGKEHESFLKAIYLIDCKLRALEEIKKIDFDLKKRFHDVQRDCYFIKARLAQAQEIILNN